MKVLVLLSLVALSAVSCTFMETKVSQNSNKNKYLISVILNVHGNVTTLTALPFATPYASPPNVTHPAPNLKTQFAT